MTEKEEKVRTESNREDILQRAEKNGRWDGIDLKVEERGMWLSAVWNGKWKKYEKKKFDRK